MVRGLHSTTNEADIKEELAKLGHEAARVTNVIIKKKINDMQTKIKIEPPRIKKEIPQCKNCQGFRHTQNYYQRKARCVKCGSHHSSEYRKSKNSACTCATCGGEHTANWKGCHIYKDKLASLQKSKMTATQRVQQRTWTPANKVTPSESFAKAASKNLVQMSTHLTATQTVLSEPSIHDIWDLLHNIQQMLTANEHRIDMLEQVNRNQKPKNTVNSKNK